MSGLFEQFPHTNLHELNLDWLIDMINQFKEELEDSAVLSVNGQTGHVTLYESENVILPPLPSGVDQWRLVRMMDGQYVGIMFYNNHAYIQRGNETMRLLTLEDIPSSSGVVSWNGLTGVVNVTGADIPIDDTADADSILQALETETTNRVNADNVLQNNINEIGSYITTTRYVVDVPSDNNFHVIDTIHPGVGNFMIISNVLFPPNANAERSISLSTDETADQNWFVSIAAAPLGSTAIQVVRFHSFTANDNMYLLARQESGSQLTVTYRTFAIKLKSH